MNVAATLRGVSPFGPIFGKVLRVTSRRKRSYLLRVLYLGTLLLFLLMVYATTAEMYGATGVAARNQQMSELGTAFFYCFTIFSVFSMGLIGPVLTCTSVGSERLAKTLPVLLMTPISAWQIVSGKLFSRLLAAVTLIGLSLPVLALVRLLGGVELEQMLAVVCVAAAAAMGAAAIGIFFSTIMNKAYGVLLLSYATIGVFYVFVPMITMLLVFSGSAGPPKMGILSILSAFNPYFCAIMVINGRAFAMGGVFQLRWIDCVAVQVVLTFLLLLASALLIRRSARREAGRTASGATTTPPPDLQSPEATQHKSFKRTAKTSRDVSDSPILWRELRRTLMPTRKQGIAGAIATIIVLGISYYALFKSDVLGQWYSQNMYAMGFNFVGWLLATVIAATAIAQEKESDTWTLLLATPLSGRAIVWGKALGVIRRMFWPTMLLVAHFFAFTLAGVIEVPAMLLIVWVIISFNCIWVATGVYLSLRFKKVTTAVIINILLALLFYGGIPLLAVTISNLIRPENGPPHHKLVELIAWYEPYYYIGVGIEKFCYRDHHSISAPGFDSLRLTGTQLLEVIGVVGLVHIAAAASILAYVAWRFDHLVGRAPQEAPLIPSLPPPAVR